MQVVTQKNGKQVAIELYQDAKCTSISSPTSMRDYGNYPESMNISFGVVCAYR